jgi:hypothetical protein
MTLEVEEFVTQQQIKKDLSDSKSDTSSNDLDAALV